MKTHGNPAPDLTALFRTEANQRFADMASALALLESDPTRTEELVVLMRRFHSFAGVSGLEGLEMITSLGARGELECRRALAEGAPAGESQLRRWRSMLDIMKDEVVERPLTPAVEMFPPGADAYVGKPLDFDLALRMRSLVQRRDECVARILSVEDDLDQAAYLREVLESAGYDVRSCSERKQFEAHLVEFAPDLILMDILLPEVSGYELAQLARSNDACHTTPILFLTTEGQLHTRIQSMRSGGDDHIVKPVSPSLLLAAVETRIERARQIRRYLDHDNLTGLLNRDAFLRRVKERVTRAEQAPAALAILDVDRFKEINDTHGHPFGDQVLSRLSSFLRTRVRVSDSVGRYGGEEFTMLINDATEQEALQLIDRLRAEFAAMPHATSYGGSVFVTFSAGVVTMPRDVEAIPRALEAADRALYRAKAEGRNCVCAATPRFPTRISA